MVTNLPTSAFLGTLATLRAQHSWCGCHEALGRNTLGAAAMRHLVPLHSHAKNKSIAPEAMKLGMFYVLNPFLVMGIALF